MSTEDFMKLTPEEKLDYISKQTIEEPKLCKITDPSCTACE